MTSTWHNEQDVRINDAIALIDKVYNSDSPVIRLRAVGCEVIADKHFHNLVAEKRKDADFTLFDMGCGRGELLERAKMYFTNVKLFGIDSNEASIHDALKKCPDAQISKGLFQDVTGQYDVVVCCEVFEHVEDYEGLLDKLYEITKPGGMLTISTPSGWMCRTPRRYNVANAIRNWAWYKRNYIEPEKHWLEALNVHPAIWPKKLIKLCEKRGYKLMSRQSALWYFAPGGYVNSWFEKRAEKDPNKAAVDYVNLMIGLDGMMNVFPFLRFNETRFILALRKPMN